MMRITAFLLLPLTLGCAAKPSTDPILIGVLAPLTGPRQRVGQSIEQGVQLAIEEAKDQPIKERAVEAVVVDTQGNAATAFHQSIRLLKINRVSALIGGHDAATAEKLCRVGENYQTSVVTLHWLPARELGPFGVTVAPAPADQGKALAKYGLNDSQRVAVLTDSRDPAASVLTATFLAQVKADRVSFQGLYQEKDLAGVAQLAAKSKPDVSLVAGRAEDLPTIRQELTVPLLFGGSDDGATADVWTSPFAVEPGSQAFVDKFTKRFGQAPDAMAVLAYDATRLWIESARKAADAEEGKIMDELIGWQDFPSVTGPLTIDKEHAAHRPIFVLRAGKVVGTWKP